MLIYQVGSGLRDRDFHAGRGHHHPSGSSELVIPRPTTQHRDKYSWDDPVPDPDNVFNVFARHQRNQGIYHTYSDINKIKVFYHTDSGFFLVRIQTVNLQILARKEIHKIDSHQWWLSNIYLIIDKVHQ